MLQEVVGECKTPVHVDRNVRAQTCMLFCLWEKKFNFSMPFFICYFGHTL